MGVRTHCKVLCHPWTRGEPCPLCRAQEERRTAWIAWIKKLLGW